ncbi:MAG TPA: adenylate/guanylate cyclase domain-containing protein [Opitutaceae bacterium]|nr:adenylate/guanylate cyclase domain-containing protein [Opitutaceae bacterium]
MASLKKSALFQLRWLLLAPIPFAWCVVWHMGLLAVLENQVTDWRFRYRGAIESPVKVVYVDVDSIALQEIGNMPWSRVYFATVAKTLIERAGVRAVGMDFVFDDAGVAESVDMRKLVAGNRALGGYLWKIPTPPVVVGASYTAGDFRDSNGKKEIREFPDVTRPDLPPLRQIEPPETPSLSVAPGRTVGAPIVGIIDTVNGEARWVRLFAPTSVKTYYAVAVELARLYYGVEEDGIKVEGDHMDLVRPDGTLATRIPLSYRQQVEINWFSPWFDATHNPRVSLADVYEYSKILESQKPDERKTAEEFFAQFKDSVVLIGPTDKLLQDVAPTPVDDVAEPKVGVHGNLLKTIVSGKYIRRLPPAAVYVIVFGLSALVAALAVAGGGRAVFAKAMAVLSAVLYAAIAFQLFKSGQIIIPLVAPLGSAFSTSFVSLVWQIVEEQKQKGRIKGMFGTYVSPALVNQMVDSGEEPKLGGVVEHITAYFSDIESFSTMSEKLSPSLLVELMNEYLTACTDILQAEGGTLDKYIGDAVIMIYGAPLALPGHAHKACVASLRVQARIAELRAKWTGEGDKWPAIVHRLQARLGLNTGPAVVGNMGSTTRFSYTMMSDDVNIAARMESGAKAWGVYTMCTDATRTECEKVEPGRVLFRALGRIVVKGRAQPVPIFELVALSEGATDANRECIATFEKGLARYYARDWDGALELFRRSEALEVNGPGRTTGAKTNPSLVYIEKAGHFKAEPPPADWDGVEVMKEK